MALKRYRSVQYRDHFAVLDHGDPVTDDDGNVRTVRVDAGQGAGSEVPLYEQDGDPADPNTRCRIVWRSGGNTPEDAAEAVAETERRNRADDPKRPDLIPGAKG